MSVENGVQCWILDSTLCYVVYWTLMIVITFLGICFAISSSLIFKRQTDIAVEVLKLITFKFLVVQLCPQTFHFFYCFMDSLKYAISLCLTGSRYDTHVGFLHGF